MGKRVYRVKKGDDFIKISRKLYGNASYVMDLMRANPGFYRLGKGMVLRLPKEDPRVTRQRKIKRRMKDYVPPPEEPEETTTQDFPMESEESWSGGEASESENLGLSTATSILSGAVLGGLDDPAFEDEIISSIAETARKMGLIGSKMGEGSVTMGEASSTGKSQYKSKGGKVSSSGLSTSEGAHYQTDESSQTTAESTTPSLPLTNEQIDKLKEKMEKLGLDVDVAMEELGLGEGAEASTSSTTTQTTSDGVGDGAETSSGDGEDDGKDGSSSNIPILDQPEEPTPPEKPKDMVDLLESVESEEELEQWRETLSTMNFRPEVRNGLEYMAAKKEKELNKLDLLAYNPWEYFPEDVLSRIKKEVPYKYSLFPGFRNNIAKLVAWARNLDGELPNYRGIEIAETYVPKGGKFRGVDATAIAAAIALQSQNYYKGKDSKEGVFYKLKKLSGGSSGIGIAQITDEEMRDFEFEGLDQEDPEVALMAMAKRIRSALNALETVFGENISSQDMLVVAALAQNGRGFNVDEIKETLANDRFKDSDDSPDWEGYFTLRGEEGEPGEDWAKDVQKLKGKQFDTQIMLQLYINDLRELHDRGWELPFGLEEGDLDEVEKTLIIDLKIDLD